MLKYLIILIITMNHLNAQEINGSTNTSSNSSFSPYAVGEIFIDKQSGFLGANSFFSTTNIVVEDIVKEDNYIVIPNPIVNKFSIINKSGTLTRKLSIFGINGEKINISPIDNFYDISYLPSGIYYIVANKIKVLKLIKI